MISTFKSQILGNNVIVDLKADLSAYIHIPFCATKCLYCDFNTYSGIESIMSDYVKAVGEEISIWGEVVETQSLKSIFFGGGTPSYLPIGEFEYLINLLRKSFDIADNAEITIEANPEDVSELKSKKWLELGVNRVSLGIQSLDDNILVNLGRRHSSDKAIMSFEMLRKVGFENLSVDLMFGLPNQTKKHWYDSLTRIIKLSPDHLSLYGLQIEKGTPLEVAVDRKELPMPDDDLAADMYEKAVDELNLNGFTHYEISNWCKPGMESVHNLQYWNNLPYVGIGAGAHSSMFGYRFMGTKSPREYLQILNKGNLSLNSDSKTTKLRKNQLTEDYPVKLPIPLKSLFENGHIRDLEHTTLALAVGETMMMGLRLNEGVRYHDFKSKFGIGIQDVFNKEIQETNELGLLEVDLKGIRLTKHGRLLGNEVFMRFLEASERVFMEE